MTRLIRSEMLKLRTTHIWWVLLLGTVLVGIAATAGNLFDAYFMFHQTTQPDFDAGGNPVPGTGGVPIEATADQIVERAANVYTSGQLIGVLFVLVLGVLIVTNEFRHKTASATFLAEPHRSRVIAAKLVTAVVWGVIFCATVTAIAIPAGAIAFSTWDIGSQLGERVVIQSILLNLMAFGIWAVFGIGLGTLVKNQIVAVIVAIVLYIGQAPVAGGLAALGGWLKQEWIVEIINWLPTGASVIMTNPIRQEGHPGWWAAALALLAYGVVAGGIGTAITARRDIS